MMFLLRTERETETGRRGRGEQHKESRAEQVHLLAGSAGHSEQSGEGAFYAAPVSSHHTRGGLAQARGAGRGDKERHHRQQSFRQRQRRRYDGSAAREEGLAGAG